MMNLLDVLTRTWEIYFPGEPLAESFQRDGELLKELPTEDRKEPSAEKKIPAHEPEDLREFQKDTLIKLRETELNWICDVNKISDIEFTIFIEESEHFLALMLVPLRLLNENRLFSKLYHYFLEDFQKKFSYTDKQIIYETGYGFSLCTEDKCRFHVLRRKALSTAHECGWKLHISIDDRDRNNLTKAWHIILKYAFQYQIARLKVVNLKVLPQDAKRPSCEVGKQVTIYCDDELNDEFSVTKWKIFIDKVTEELRDSGIRGGFKGDHVKYFNEYFGYRNDADEYGRYRLPDEAPYKIDEIVDPFEHFNLMPVTSTLQKETRHSSVVTTAPEELQVDSESQSSNHDKLDTPMAGNMQSVGHFKFPSNSNSSSEQSAMDVSISEEPTKSSEISDSDISETFIWLK